MSKYSRYQIVCYPFDSMSTVFFYKHSAVFLTQLDSLRETFFSRENQNKAMRVRNDNYILSNMTGIMYITGVCFQTLFVQGRKLNLSY